MRGSHLVTNHSLGKTSYEGSCACDIQLDSSLEGSFPLSLQAGTGSSLLCTLLLVLPYCHSMQVPHQNRQIRKYSKGKYILEDQYKFLRVWRVSYWFLYQGSLSSGRRGGVFFLSLGQHKEVISSHTEFAVSRKKCLSGVSCSRSIINRLLLLRLADFETQLSCTPVPSKSHLETREIGGRGGLVRSPPLKQSVVHGPSVWAKLCRAKEAVLTGGKENVGFFGLLLLNLFQNIVPPVPQEWGKPGRAHAAPRAPTC